MVVSAATVVATFACLWLMRIFDFALLSVLGLVWPMAAAIPSVAATFDVDAAWRRFLIGGLASHVVPAPNALLLAVEIVGLAHGDTEPISAAMIALRLARFSGGVPGQRHEPPPSRSKGALADLFGLDFCACRLLISLAFFRGFVPLPLPR